MHLKNYGGNFIGQLTLDRSGKYMLGSGPYEYFFYFSQAHETLILDDLRSFTILLFLKPQEAKVMVTGLTETPDEGDCLQVEDCPLRLEISGGPVHLLVSGTRTPHPQTRGLSLTRHARLYKVVKPWGHELWLNGQHPGYALKQIFLKAGSKTSLQYHNFKQETNVLFRGATKLHYKLNPALPNQSITVADIGAVQLEPVSTIGVSPSTLHRLEAVTDILLYETSTPHLDDVVRVQDDAKRPDGRIAAEHQP